jgi:hypothetical protein
VTCPEQRVVAFLAGELSGEQEQLFDQHLLGCEECWQAVQAGRAARLALEKLREPAPPGLYDRVSLAVGLATEAVRADEGGAGPSKAQPGSWPGLHYPARRWPSRHRPAERREARRRAWPPVLAAACVALLGAGALGWSLAGSGPADPPQVAAVVAMMTPHAPPSTALRAGEHMMVAHQPLMVRAYEMGGREAIVATSERPFPMPATSHLLPGSSPKAWMAAKGDLSMYGVNRPAGEESMFVVAAVPAAELPQLAASLHLI